MGIEFIRKATKSFRRRWDHGRLILGTADLFTCEPTWTGRTLPFDLAKNAGLQVGDTVVVELEGTVLVARCSLNLVAKAENPPASVLEAIKQSCGIASGTVEQVFDLAAVAEITLC